MRVATAIVWLIPLAGCSLLSERELDTGPTLADLKPVEIQGEATIIPQLGLSELAAVYREVLAHQHDPATVVKIQHRLADIELLSGEAALADALSSERLFDPAIAAYEKAIELDPKEARYHYNLGILYTEGGEVAKAIAAYEKAIALNPTDAFPHNNLGNLYTDEGESEKAICAYERAIALNPNLAAPHNGLGNLYNERRERKKAITAFEKAIALDSTNTLTYYNLGILALCRGCPDYSR